MQPRLVLINGIPGSGKTTLAARLKPDLGLPLLCKDDLKEFFFDTLGVSDRNESRMLGKVSSEILYILIENYLATGRSLAIESAFYAEFARPAVQAVVDRYPVDVLEIYCQTDPVVRRQRFYARVDDGSRHAGHRDGDNRLSAPEPEADLADRYAPIGIGKLITVDTTQFDDAEYTELLGQIQTALASRN